MGRVVVCFNSLINRFLKFIRRAIYDQAKLVFDRAVKSFDFASALGMVGRAINMFYAMTC